MPPKAPAKAAKANAALPPPGCAFVRHPESIGCGFHGVDLVPDDDGRLLVPLAAVDELAAHGFVALSAA